MAASGHKDTRPEMVVAHWLAGTPKTKVQIVSKSSCRRETAKSVLSENFLRITKCVHKLICCTIRSRREECKRRKSYLSGSADLCIILYILDRLAQQECQQEVVHLWDVDVVRHKPCQHLEAWHMPRLLADFTH